MGVAVSVLNIVFVIGFGYVFLAQRAVFYSSGVTTAMRQLLILPMLYVPLTVPLAVLTALTWRDGHTRLIPRIHHSIVLMAGLAMVWLTNYYNLLGFRY